MGHQDIVFPVRQGVDDRVSGPDHAKRDEDLAPAERRLRAHALQQRGTGGASDGETCEEDREDQRKDIDRREHQHAEQPCPDYFGAECRGARKGDRQVDWPVAAMDGQRDLRVQKLPDRAQPVLRSTRRTLTAATTRLMATAT